ncbi:hypothetical protein D1871_10275 [Nakamurella silvestris]|nr:hypothetical protein D1871_10275 [Nakamurella silvestris]
MGVGTSSSRPHCPFSARSRRLQHSRWFHHSTRDSVTRIGPAMLWTPLLAAALGLLIVTAPLFYNSRWTLPAPPLGVFDASDIILLAVVVVLYPVLALVESVTVAAVINAVLILAAVGDLLHPSIRRRWIRLAVLAAVGVAVTGIALGHPAGTYGWLLTDLLLLAVVVSVAVAWAQQGATLTHMAFLAGFLVLYDVVATTLTAFMGDLLDHLSTMPLGFVFTLPGADGTAYLGVGDALILALVPVITQQTRGTRRALAAAGAMFLALLGGVAISAAAPGIPIPLMITLGPATICLYVLDRRRRRPRPASATTPPFPRTMLLLAHDVSCARSNNVRENSRG